MHEFFGPVNIEPSAASEFNAQSGFTALISASSEGRADCARLLIYENANKEAKDTVLRVVTAPLCFV